MEAIRWNTTPRIQKEAKVYPTALVEEQKGEAQDGPGEEGRTLRDASSKEGDCAGAAAGLADPLEYPKMRCICTDVESGGSDFSLLKASGALGLLHGCGQ